MSDADVDAHCSCLFDGDKQIQVCPLHQKQADEIARLRERCEAYRGQVEAGAAEIERLRMALSEAIATTTKPPE